MNPRQAMHVLLAWTEAALAAEAPRLRDTTGTIPSPQAAHQACALANLFMARMVRLARA